MKPKIVLIGASTGGPALIKELLFSLNKLSYTIIIAQHMREEVLPSFIKELQSVTAFSVHSTPMQLEPYKPSVIICASSIVIVKKGMEYFLEKESTNQNFTPDINKLFHSFNSYVENFDIEVFIMTGMGNDGVEGAKTLKKKDVKVVAQDENSSPLYGMPRVAKESGVAEIIYSFDEIKSYLGTI